MDGCGRRGCGEREKKWNRKAFHEVSSEWMGAVGADGKLQLDEGLVGLDALGVAAAAVLAADLGELARPEGQRNRFAPVARVVVSGAVGELVAQTAEPAARDLIVPRDVEARPLLNRPFLLAPRAEVLAPQDERSIRPAAQRLPPIDEVRVAELRRRVGRHPVEAAAVAHADLQIVVVSEVPVETVLGVEGELAPRRRVEKPVHVATKDLRRELREGVAGKLDQLCDRNAGVAPTILAPEEIDHGKWLVRPWEDMEVHRVD